jgi:hypothetical protein
VRKLVGRYDIEDALGRLDTLTMEETRMAIAETLNIPYSLDTKEIKRGRWSEYIDLHILLLLTYLLQKHL